MGDFNYNYHLTNQQADAPVEWHACLHTHLVDCITIAGEALPSPTFRRGSATHSTIDFFFASKAFRQFIRPGQVEYLPPEWTDHALLIATLSMGVSSIGKGYWRGNPHYALHREFRRQLADNLTTWLPGLQHMESPSAAWDALKFKLKRFLQSHGRSYTN